VPQPNPPLPPLSPTQIQEWWGRVELARRRRQEEADLWKELLTRYLPPKDGKTVNTNLHFRNVETKKAQLFFQLPELQVEPLPALQAQIDPATQQPLDPSTAIAAKRAVLDLLLSRDYADVGRTIDEAIFDTLAVSGVGATKICYEADQPFITQDVPTGETTPVPGQVLGLGAPPVAQTAPQQVPGVPVYERWRWYRFSPGKLLVPADFHSTRFDDAPWVGMEFTITLETAVRLGYVSPDFQANASKDDTLLDVSGKTDSSGAKKLVKGVELWLRAVDCDASAVHSQLQYCLVLIEGQPDRTGQYRISPYQTLLPDGSLTLNDSMIGYPIHPLTLRDLTDSAWVPSDSAVTDPLVRQLNTWRQQSIKLRDANLPRFVHPDSITTALNKLEDADAGQGVGINDDLFNQLGEKIIVPLPKLERAESDIQGEAAIQRNLDETLGVGSNQAGTITNTVRSATETATVQANISVRLQKERGRVLDWYLAGVRKFDSLVVRYGDLQNLTPLVGQPAAQSLMLWHSVNGRNGFSAKPDSQLSQDAAAERKMVLDYVNFVAKSPFINQKSLMELVTQEFGYDASKLVADPQPPGPPPPNVSFRFGGADLGIPEVRALLGVLNPQLSHILAQPPSAEAMQAAAGQAAKALPHGGAADRADTISDHHTALSGHMDGPNIQGAVVPHVGGIQ
jgi:hypothetical protein